MTLTPDDDLNETARQRTRDQIALLRQAYGGDIIVDSDDDADFTFVCSSRHVLVNAADVAEVEGYFSEDRNGVFDPEQPGRLDDDENQPRDGLVMRYIVPARLERARGDKGLLLTLDELDRDARPDLAVPDHVVHICRPIGSQCPATEPTETGRTEPWPKKVTGNVGKGVTVVVIDTGWYAPQPLPWDHLGSVGGEPELAGVFGGPNLDEIRPYAGHGTFVAGVVRSMAPECSVYVLSLQVDAQVPGGGVFESDMVRQLDASLSHHPDLINLSAGCPTRNNRPARAFENWWNDVRARANPPLMVAAAGNNSSPWGFWPASSDWAVGVGSLDRDGTVSDFSNWGDSVDVYALGRNLINAFPRGKYLCREAPDRGDWRQFVNDYARWSGTSFSAPLVTGLIAAAMSPQGQVVMDAEQAKAAVLGMPPTKLSLTMREVPVVRGDLFVPQL